MMFAVPSSAPTADDHPTPKLLLASRSPRRAMLLREAGFMFTQVDPPFADPADPNLAFAEDHDGPATAIRLAERKIQSIPDDWFASHASAVTLTADTLGVTPAGRLVGTPETRDQARAMIADLLNQTHTIVTAVALRQPDGQTHAFADTAAVNLGQVNEDQLREYVQSDQWVGKAGGYNLLERQNAGWRITVHGDPATVMGLPMQRLVPRLQQLGIVPTAGEAHGYDV